MPIRFHALFASALFAAFNCKNTFNPDVSVKFAKCISHPNWFSQLPIDRLRMRLPLFCALACVLLNFHAVREVMAAADLPDHHHGTPPMKLIRFDVNESNNSGAVCLDGSPSGIYYSPAKTKRGSTRWVLFIEGGGW
jgi:hypothetical protein